VSTVDKYLSRRKRLKAFMKALKAAAEDADVIYAQKAVAAGWPAFKVSKKFRVPLVVHFPHDEVWERLRARDATASSELADDATVGATLYERLIAYLQRRVLQSAHRVLVHTERHKRAFIKRYGLSDEQCVVLPQPVRPAVVLPFPPDDRPRVFIVPPQKTSRELAGELQTLDKYRSLHQDLELVLMNTPCSERDPNEQEHVRCLAHTTRAELWYLARQATALVLLDSAFADQLALTEYLSIGVPIVAPETNLAAELFGLSVVTAFEPDTPDSLRDVLEALLTRPARRAVVQQTAAELVRERYSWEAHLASLVPQLTATP